MIENQCNFLKINSFAFQRSTTASQRSINCNINATQMQHRCNSNATSICIADFSAK